MDTDLLWKTVLAELEVLITKPTFATFFAPSSLISFEKGVATVGCNSGVAITIMETRYYALLKSLLDKHAKQNVSLIFKTSPVKPKPQENGPLFSHLNTPSIKTDSGSFLESVRQTKLRPDFIFDTFAVSSSNQMAYATATAVANNPGNDYNPLFFYGGVGVGKTHLMQAIGNQIFVRNPNEKIIYCMGEEFTNEIIDAIQTKTTKRFKDKYRNARVLLIDDVQFLEGKIRVQEEFFHTFNSVQRDGGQIVLTSDRPPHEIDRLDERLQSRFEAGLIVDVHGPDFETRCAILRIKAQQKNVNLSMAIAQILAANTDSVRKLEGFLTRLLSESKIKKLPISEDLARSVVGKPGNETTPLKRPSVSPKQIIEIVLRRYNLTIGQIKGERRNRPLARPRQILMYLLRTELRLPLDEVGTWVGGRDHTTVLHAVDNVSKLLSTNEGIRTDIEWIKKTLFG